MFYYLKEIMINRKIKKERAKKGYSWIDVCNVDLFLQTTFVNMLKELEDNKNGYKELEFEEVYSFPAIWINEQYNEIIKSIKKSNWFSECTEEEIEEYSIYDYYIRERLIIRRIIYCLEQSTKELCSEVNEYEKEYFDKKYGDIKDLKDLFVQCEDNPKLYKLKTNEVKKSLETKYIKRKNQIDKYRIKMKDEAFKLISKYFDCLSN